jgi:F0F1-type ATP synthase assembly protein I
MTITCPVNDSIGICNTLDSTGAGLGVLFQYLGASLPVLLIVLAVIGGIVAIIMAIAMVIRKSMGHSVGHGYK